MSNQDASRTAAIEQKLNLVRGSDDVLWTILNSDVLFHAISRFVDPNNFYLTNYSIDGVDFNGYTNYSSRRANWKRYIILNDTRKQLLRTLGIELAREYSSFFNCWDFKYNGCLFRWHNNTDGNGKPRSRIFIALSEHDQKAWRNDVAFEYTANEVCLAPSAEVDIISEENLNDDYYKLIFFSKLYWLGKQTQNAPNIHGGDQPNPANNLSEQEVGV